MPLLDGPKTITSSRSDERLQSLTLIAISGSDTNSPDLQRARRAVDFWITRPADPERITGTISDLARRSTHPR